MIEIKHRSGIVLYRSENVETFLAALEEAVKAGTSLAGANLAGANLAGANLAGANLAGANLAGANLECASLAFARLYGANLEGANLAGANLAGASLEGVNLVGVSLAFARLYGANLEGANLAGATGFRFPDAPDPSVLRKLVADQIEIHPELHWQSEWGTGEPDCKTGQCVAGWACSLGGGPRDSAVASAAVRLLWVEGKPMPSFSSNASRASILEALRA